MTIDGVLQLEFCYLTLPERNKPVLNVRAYGDDEVLHRYVLTYDQLLNINAGIARALLLGRPS